MQKDLENVKKLFFADYYKSQSVKEKIAFRRMFIPKYMEYSTFYYKLKSNAWTTLEFEKLLEITGIEFSTEPIEQFKRFAKKQ